jgi:hypothetical protein
VCVSLKMLLLAADSEQSWRRRMFELKGCQLIASNEVTKQIHAVMEMPRLTAVTDLHSAIDSPDPSTQMPDFDDESYEVKHSFKLTFDNATEEVHFYADNEALKREWLRVLSLVLQQNAERRKSSKSKDLIPPLWAVALQRQQLESKQKPSSAPSQQQLAQAPSQRKLAQAPSQQKLPQAPSQQQITTRTNSMPAIPERGESSASLPEETRVRQQSPEKPPVPKKDSSQAIRAYADAGRRPNSYAAPSTKQTPTSNRFSVHVDGGRSLPSSPEKRVAVKVSSQAPTAQPQWVSVHPRTETPQLLRRKP